MLTWPALHLVEELPSDGALNGKADDFLTGVVVALLLVGLLAAGWLSPLRVVLPMVFLIGVGVPFLYDAVSPRGCPEGASGMDCLPIWFGALYALPGVLIVCLGWLLRLATGSPATPLIHR